VVKAATPTSEKPRHGIGQDQPTDEAARKEPERPPPPPARHRGYTAFPRLALLALGLPLLIVAIVLLVLLASP